MRLVRVIVAGIGMLVSAVVWPDTAVGQDFELTIENIMRGPELVGRSPQALRGGRFGNSGFDWSPDSRYVYFRWQQPGVDTALAPYRVAADGGDPERLTDRAADSVLAGNGVWSRDRRRAVFVVSGDLVLWDGDESRRLTNTFEAENNPHWSADGREVFFRRGSNLFALHVDRGALRQLTDIRSGNAPSERDPSDQRAFLAEQERELLAFIRDSTYREQPWFREPQADSTRPEPY